LTQKFTQERLARLAGVSTPTLSRFENNEKDIQLSSALNILGVLGMTDQRQLYFLDKDVTYLPDRMVVTFWGKTEDKKIRCEISHEALCDHYNGDGKDKVKVFQANRSNIEHEARRKYLANNLENDGTILIRTTDL
jgi:DNA-binding XRE family transcriptional regulator